jgi:hypothetical protein
MKNNASTTADRILDHLPVGILAIDCNGMVVYTNKKVRDLVGVEGLGPGSCARGTLDGEIFSAMMLAIGSQEPTSLVLNKGRGFDIVCTPLPDKVGAISVFIPTDLGISAEIHPQEAANSQAGYGRIPTMAHEKAMIGFLGDSSSGNP